MLVLDRRQPRAFSISRFGLAFHAAVREIGPLPTGRVPCGDEHLVALLAVDPRAVLITGDRTLARQVGARALTPREFLARLSDET